LHTEAAEIYIGMARRSISVGLGALRVFTHPLMADYRLVTKAATVQKSLSLQSPENDRFLLQPYHSFSVLFLAVLGFELRAS
jgi:hypothetical protein